MDNYLPPLLGGLIIGLSAVLLMYLLGRIAGVSGIFWKAVEPGKLSSFTLKDRLWCWLFVLGLPLGAWLASTFSGVTPMPPESSNPLIVIISGLLVGLGSKLGSGCTSGHGVCGISRLSIRSIIATLVFMGSGIATVFIARTFGGLI